MDGTHPSLNLGYSDDTGLRMPKNCRAEYNTVSYDGSVKCGEGMNIAAQYCVIAHNTVHDSYWAGIVLTGHHNEVSDNEIYNVKSSWAPGIEIYDGNNNEVLRNHIYRTATGTLVHGISLYKGYTSGCNANHIADNRIENPSDSAVLIYDSGSTGNIVEYNTFVKKGTIDNWGTGTIIRSNTVVA
jgi:hypothetical protein